MTRQRGVRSKLITQGSGVKRAGALLGVQLATRTISEDQWGGACWVHTDYRLWVVWFALTVAECSRGRDAVWPLLASMDWGSKLWSHTALFTERECERVKEWQSDMRREWQSELESKRVTQSDRVSKRGTVRKRQWETEWQWHKERMTEWVSERVRVTE